MYLSNFKHKKKKKTIKVSDIILDINFFDSLFETIS